MPPGDLTLCDTWGGVRGGFVAAGVVADGPRTAATTAQLGSAHDDY